MGVGLTKEKLLELIKNSSKKSTNENNYRIEFKLDQENEIVGGEIESLDIDNKSNAIIKEVHQFPYVAIGTITIKFSSGEITEHTCFAINDKIIVTCLSFLKHNKKFASEATTTLTNERLIVKNCIKNDKKNLAIFFLENTRCGQWIGVDEYITHRNSIDKKIPPKNYGDLKVIFSVGKGTSSELNRSESTVFMDERTSLGGNNKLIPFLKEIKINNNVEKIEDGNEENKIVGGVIYYKTQQSGGVYAVGLINEKFQPSFFDRETLKYLYEQVNKAQLSNTEGVDVKNVIELDLSKKNIGPSHIKMLTEFNLKNLKKLNLLKNQIGPQGAFYLGQSKFNNLEILILNFNEIGDEGVQYLSKGPFLELKYLYLFHNNISNIGVEYILDSIFNDALLLLDLSDNPNIDDEGISSIKNRIQGNNSVLKELLCLNLSATTINDAALKVLNEIKFRKLRKLIMQDIDFSKCNNYIDFMKAKSYEIKTDGII